MLRSMVNRITGYDSALWTDNTTLNPTSYELNVNESKLEAFNNYPIKGLRLCMSSIDGTNIQWLDVLFNGQTAMSLQALAVLILVLLLVVRHG